VPITDRTAFLAIIDDEGNFLSSNFFYNVSYPVEEVLSCHQHDDYKLTTLVKVAENKLAVMTLSLTLLSVENFYTLENTVNPLKT